MSEIKQKNIIIDGLRKQLRSYETKRNAMVETHPQLLMIEDVEEVSEDVRNLLGQDRVRDYNAVKEVIGYLQGKIASLDA